MMPVRPRVRYRMRFLLGLWSRGGERSADAVSWIEAERFSGTIRNGFPVSKRGVCDGERARPGSTRPVGRSGRTPPRAASAASRRAAQHRLPARGGEGRLRHLGRGRAREGNRRSGRRRSRNALPALPAALGPGQAVLQREIDACADAAPALAAANEPGVALAKWLHRYTEFVATKRGLAAALHSGDPAFDALPGYFLQRLGPALASLLERATASGEIRAGISPKDLLYAVASLCLPWATTESHTASAWSRSSSTDCATGPRRASPASEVRADRFPRSSGSTRNRGMEGLLQSLITLQQAWSGRRGSNPRDPAWKACSRSRVQNDAAEALERITSASACRLRLDG